MKKILSDHWRFAVGVLTAALLVVELMLRFFLVPAYPPIELAFDHDDRNCARPVAGSARVWHQKGIMGKPVVHRFNNLGVRNDLPDPAADLRVAVLGGDAVYGIGVETDATLPAALETIFAARYPERRIRFLNFGFPGFNVEEQIRELKRLEPLFSPDLVLVALDNESFRPSLCARRALPARNLLNDNLAIARVVEKSILPVELIPGNALFRRATASDVERIVRTIERVHGQRTIFAQIDDLLDIDGKKGGRVTVNDVLESSGYKLLKATNDVSCIADESSSDNGSQTAVSDDTLADRMACAIEPYIATMFTED